MGKNKELAVGIFVLIGLLCVGYLTVKLGKMELSGGDSYTLYARFHSVAGLRTGAEVEIAGVSVGRVSSITLDTATSQAVVALSLSNNVELTEDVIASVKTSGIIGDKYINLTPGGYGEILMAGDTIIETESALDIEELISKFVFGEV